MEFADVWAYEADFVETPNCGRGGSSGVVTAVFAGPDGHETRIFVKRQSNHLTRALGPFFRKPTARREFQNLIRLKAAGFTVPEVLFFAEERLAVGWRAVLITSELSGRLALSELVQTWQQQGWPSRGDVSRLIDQIAGVSRALHDLGYRHGSLYAKHLFVDPLNLGAAIGLIDLEKMRRTPFRNRARRLDLDALNRRTMGFSRSDRLRFLKIYLARQEATLPKLWKELATRYRHRAGPVVPQSRGGR